MTATSSSLVVAPQPFRPEQLANLATYFVRWVLLRRPMLACHADDLRQEAAVGVLVAARKFDAARGARFSTFAWWWMRAAIERYLKAGRQEQQHLEELTEHAAELADERAGEQASAAELSELGPDLEWVVASLRRFLLKRMLPRRPDSCLDAAGPLRDVEFFLCVLRGDSLAAAGRRFGVSRERARQVVDRLRPSFEVWRAALN